MRKHSTWLWSIIIVVVIFAFVIWGTNTGHQGGGSSGALARINGQPVTEEDLLSAKKEVLLGFYLRNNQMPGVEAEQRGFNLERETYQTLLLIQLIKEQQIHAGTEAKAAIAANIIRSLQSQGINTLAEFETAVLQKEGFSLADLDRYVGHQISLQQLMSLQGLSGQLITPQQLESLWRRENQALSAQAVFFSASNFLQSVEVTPEALGSFFTNQMARYRIPERIQVAYVAYPISNYLSKADERFAAVTNLTEQIDKVYQQRGTNFYAELTPDQAREQILQEERRKVAIMAARQEAAAFADELWRQEPMKPDDLRSLGTQKGLTVKVTEPFDRTSAPAGLQVDPTFAKAAFQLRDDEPFAGPLQGEDQVYVITLSKRIPSENARFEEVKARVTEDYRLQEATLKARELGRAFAEQLTNSLAAGKAFTETCTAAGYKPQLLPDFSQNTRSLPEVEEHTSLGQFMQVAFSTPERSASGFNFTRDGGYIVYVNSKLPVDEVVMKAELPRFAQYVRQSLQSEAFNLWFSQEASVGLRDTPLNRTPPAELNAPVN